MCQSSAKGQPGLLGGCRMAETSFDGEYDGKFRGRKDVGMRFS